MDYYATITSNAFKELLITDEILEMMTILLKRVDYKIISSQFYYKMDLVLHIKNIWAFIKDLLYAGYCSQGFTHTSTRINTIIIHLYM